MPIQTKKNPLAWLAVTSLCALLFIAGISLSISALYSLQASRFLSDWSTRAQEPQQQAWEIAYGAIEQAITWYPVENPNLYISRARIQDWRHFTSPIADPVANESRRLALKDFRHASQLQPTWPHTWVDIALIKIRLGVVDQETIDALQNALNTGPWRPDVLKGIANAGVLAWDMLPVRGKEIVIRSIDRGLASNPNTAKAIWSTISDFGQIRAICAYAHNDGTALKAKCVTQSGV